MARLCPHRIGEKVDFATADDPNALWPTTTWTQDTSGTFPMASSSEHALGSSGGSETHTLTVDEIPSHDHVYANRGAFNNNHSAGWGIVEMGVVYQGDMRTTTAGGVVSQHPQPIQGRQPLGARVLKRLGEVA